MRFDWNAANIEHIARHGVSPSEVEEVFYRRFIYGSMEVVKGEIRVTLIGATNGGRVLTITFQARLNEVRIVTARDASRKERKLYGQS